MKLLKIPTRPFYGDLILKILFNFITVILLSPLFFSEILHAQDLDSRAGDEAALEALYNATDGPNWATQKTFTDNWGATWTNTGNSRGWKSSGMSLEDDIYGVEVAQIDGELRVVSIKLNGNETLVGWDTWAGGSLESPDLHPQAGEPGGNNLEGTLPPELGNLKQCRYLNVKSNQLTGEIPPEIGKMRSLEWLALQGQLGEISLADEAWNEANHIQNSAYGTKQNIDSNLFTGQLPAELGNLPNIRMIEIRRPNLTGPLPPELGKATSLIGLFLNIRQDFEGFSGSIPSEWGSLTNLVHFHIDGNVNIAGSIPQSILDNWTSIKHFRAWGTNFGGGIPTFNTDDMRVIQVPHGGYGGEFPSHYFEGKNSQMSSFLISHNNLSGDIPDTGVISPTEPTSRPNYTLGKLNFDNNNLTGPIHEWLQEAVDQVFNATNNELTGPFPHIILGKSNMKVLEIGGNNLSGNLPDVPIASSRYITFNFWKNDFTGGFPASWSDLVNSSHRLTYFSFDGNRLEGLIPAWFAELTNAHIGAHNNKFTPKDIVPNLAAIKSGVASYEYVPQKPFGSPVTIGTGCVIDRSSFDYSGNSYRWYRNGSPVSGETAPTIDTGSYGEGTYKLEITHPDIDYTFESEPIEVTAGASCEELPDPPASPTPVSPADGATGVSTSPTLDWNSVSGADSYRVQVATSSDFSSPVVDQSGITATQQQVSGLANATSYYWRVQASNNAGSGSWSAAWSFTTASESTTATPAPVQTSPSDGARGTSLRPAFSWETVEGAESYILHVSGRDPSEMLIETTVTGTGFTPETALDAGRTHDWRVRAIVDGTEGDWSPVWAFTTGSGGDGTTAPAAPSLTSPSDGATGIATSPTLDWEAASGAETYRVQVATTSDFSAPVVDQAGFTATQQQVSGLANATSYYWRVVASNSNGATESQVQTFTTKGSDEQMETSLGQNYPNPFNPSTQIRFTLGETQQVSLKVYDTVGRVVATVVEGTLTAGSYERTFNANNLASGVYFLRFVTENRVLTSQMTLMK